MGSLQYIGGVSHECIYQLLTAHPAAKKIVHTPLFWAGDATVVRSVILASPNEIVSEKSNIILPLQICAIPLHSMNDNINDEFRFACKELLKCLLGV